MAGVSKAPPREVYIELARRIQIDGGKVMTKRHDPQPITFENSADKDAKRTAESGATSCGCGDTRMASIPYKHATVNGRGEDVEFERRYIACVNCDAVHLQPRWFTGRWKAGA
jgi:hypothetical protein